MSRFWSGAGLNRSRLHDRKGNLVDLKGALYLPHCLAHALWTKAAGHRPELPWLGYRTINWLSRTIQPEWRILEFGSGMSTLWFAPRVDRGLLVSVESDPDWHARVQSTISKRGYKHVDYRLRGADTYARAADDLPDGSFDLVLVDGILRDECAAVALRKVKPGGYVLLDNTDDTDAEHSGAEELLLDAARRSGWARHTTDLYPGIVLACESLLLHVPGPGAVSAGAPGTTGRTNPTEVMAHQ